MRSFVLRITSLRSGASRRAAKRLLSAALAAGWLACASPYSSAAVYAGATSGAAGVDAGEVLLGELNCTACHSTSAAVQARLAPKAAPRLENAGARITPQYLRAFLNNPHGEKRGTPMPDLLHGMSGEEKTAAVEPLVHFLASLQPAPAANPTGADSFKIRQGRELYHRVGCVACHAPFDPPAAFDPKAFTPAGAGSPPGEPARLDSFSAPLGNLAKKTTVEQLAKFLVDPLSVRPSGRMPSQNLTEGEATAIAMYLLREQAPGLADPAKLRKIAGLSYQYFEGSFGSVGDLEKASPVATGFVERFTLTPRKRNDNIGFRFTGFITLPADGRYTFYSSSDDGSRVYIGDELVVQNDGIHAEQEKSGSVELKAGEHPILVSFINGGGEWSLRVSFEGPGIRKQEIPANLLTHLGQPMQPLGAEDFAVDPTKAARGKQLFASLGCASCHGGGPGLPPAAEPSKYKPLAELNPASSSGCLAESPAPGAPRFDLSPAQRAALRATLGNHAKFSETLAPADQVKLTMAKLNCYACHSRDGSGGPFAQGKGDYFFVNGQADLGDEGRIPPHLNHVGAKLRSDWLGEVLWNHGAVRPYMATRMPQFGRANVGHLAAAFEQADSSGKPEPPATVSPLDAKWGRKLVGRDGVTCISCHRFGQFESLGIPAIDLTVMAKRLRKDWFERYLVEPSALRPGTRMPSFWPGGRAANEEILGGDTAKQINAIWAYLSKGAEAGVPAGLVRARMEIVADKEAVIYRNFIEGAGSRAIGVGFPEKVNLAFDANQSRLALIWQGAFIDAARHSTDRGVGFEPPLGERVTKLPEGPSFAILDSPDSPWPVPKARDGGTKFLGYRLDEKRRPAFLYSFSNLRVEDHTAARAGELDPELVRTLTVRGEAPAGKLWFRAADAAKIEPQPDGGFLIDGKLKLTFRGAAGKPLLRESGGRKELLVPVPLEGGEARFTEEMAW